MWTLVGALVALTVAGERRPLSTIGLRRLPLPQPALAVGIGVGLSLSCRWLCTSWRLLVRRERRGRSGVGDRTLGGRHWRRHGRGDRGDGVPRPCARAVDRADRPCVDGALVSRRYGALPRRALFLRPSRAASGATTGMRRGEVAGRAREDLDLDAGTVGSGGPSATSKPSRRGSHVRRATPASATALDPATVDALRAHLARQNEERLYAGPAWQARQIAGAAPTATTSCSRCRTARPADGSRRGRVCPGQ